MMVVYKNVVDKYLAQYRQTEEYKRKLKIAESNPFLGALFDIHHWINKDGVFREFYSKAIMKELNWMNLLDSTKLHENVGLIKKYHELFVVSKYGFSFEQFGGSELDQKKAKIIGLEDAANSIYCLYRRLEQRLTPAIKKEVNKSLEAPSDYFKKEMKDYSPTFNMTLYLRLADSNFEKRKILRMEEKDIIKKLEDFWK